MIEVLPIKLLSEEDAPIFGNLNVALGKLARENLAVASGIVVTPPSFKLKTTLEHFDFGSREAFEQSLTLVKKEIEAIAVPEVLVKETNKRKKFLVGGTELGSVKSLWIFLLNIWLGEIKDRLWKDGFGKGTVEHLEPAVVIFLNKLEDIGDAYFDPEEKDVVIDAKKGKTHPRDLKKLSELVALANKKLMIPHKFEWILDGGIKLTKVLLYTPATVMAIPMNIGRSNLPRKNDRTSRSAVKVFLDLSTGFSVEREIDGVYIASEKIFDLNKPRESFEDLLWRLVESSMTFPNLPILFKLADKSEGMGKIRGTLMLLHQRSLFEPLMEAALFARHKRGLSNIHLVIPFIRSAGELLKIKRELAIKKLMRKNSLQIWLELCTPENITNLEEYLLGGIDGVVLNLDELISHFSGFDNNEQELSFYKREASGLIKFLEDGLKLLHKSKKPFLAFGSIALYSEVLEFLVEKGVYGVVVERYEAHSMVDLLQQAEKRLILKRSS